MSTFCRSCGEYLPIVDGRVTLRDPLESQPRFRIAGENGEEEPSTEGAPFTLVPPADKAGDEPETETAPDDPSWGGFSTLLRRGLGQDRSSPRSVRCPNCSQSQHVSHAASSTICPGCSTYFNLEDHHIRGPSQQRIATGGDVFVHRKGSLHSSGVVCRNLRARGELSGEIQCSGEAVLGADCKFDKPFRCRRLVVERKAHIDFLGGVEAGSIEIRGRVTGELVCSGRVRVTRKGVIAGNVTAKALNIARGGMFLGNLRVIETSPSD